MYNLYIYMIIYVSATWPLLGTLKQHVQIKPLVGFRWIFPYIPPFGDFHPKAAEGRWLSEALGRHPTPWQSGGEKSPWGNHMGDQVFVQKKYMHKKPGEIIRETS